MEAIKSWFTSKTVIASALGVALTVAQVLGLNEAAGIDKDALAGHVVNIAEGVLYAVAIWGRLTAKHKLA